MSKKLYLYEYVDDLTTNWHSGGAVVIVTAGDPQEALDADRKKIAAQYNSEPQITRLPEPDRVIEVAATENDAIYEFPDAGCC